MLKHPAGVSCTLALVLIAALSSTACQFSPAQTPPIEFRQTENPLDLAIEDDGRSYFVLTDQAGAQYFTRNGSFKQDAAGVVVHGTSGYALAPRLTVTGDLTSVSVSAQGVVTAKRQVTNNIERIGEITLVRFSNPAALTPNANGLFTASQASGTATTGRPGTPGFGLLTQGFLEVPKP